MFETNTGMIDRIIRIVVGVALIAGFWVWPDVSWRWAFLIGVIPLLSGLVGWCPVYKLMGWSTHSDGSTGGARSA
ncbi:MAG: DUF2892 domain-containing protein [Roseovarius sp.]